jgi:hypothetical protein
MTDDDSIIAQRIAGKSVRAIAKSARTSVSEVNAVIDRWASVALTSEARKHGLALELARLDELQRTFYEKALGGDIASGAPCEKIIARRCVMLGLHAPQTAVLKIVDEATPKETSTDRIERVLNALIETRRKTIRPPIDHQGAACGRDDLIDRGAFALGREKFGESGGPTTFAHDWFNS